MEKISILITDDHRLVRETWAHVLNSEPKFNVVGVCGSGEEAVEVAKELRPNIVLMDINLPGMSGIEATQEIQKYSPSSRVLAVSLHTQQMYVRNILQKGAAGYVTKNSSSSEMFNAIVQIHAGKRYICDEIKNYITEQMMDGNEKSGVNALTRREIEIISLIRKGESSREIANTLKVSIKTVEVHRHNILKKLNLRNSSALVNFASNNLSDN